MKEIKVILLQIKSTTQTKLVAYHTTLLKRKVKEEDRKGIIS
jgi:hypothetical protein